ncbi:AAA family ATPase [Gordonia rubripertincta]|uniref:AAA family ATPase n=1 Tax=Gordonia rubripertincta TaxID=36822 RepID=UPI00117F25D9|nr:ATP-binding protein [Gordonia rubripertincta]TSD93233.1 AAA family ATPase [Gordonia rubripertincta]
MSDSLDEFDGAEADDRDFFSFGPVEFKQMEIRNFLSYKQARLRLGDLVALVGPNASGKSNAVAAVRLLRDIPLYGLPTAVARRGGFDQLRHRSDGRPYDPSLVLEFRHDGAPEDSRYELHLGAVKGGRYRVKREFARIYMADGQYYEFVRDAEKIVWTSPSFGIEGEPKSITAPVIAGQSAITTAGFAGLVMRDVLQRMQTVEVNPAKVADLQDPTSIDYFESDGSNTVGIYESLTPRMKSVLVDQLAAIVPGITKIEVANLTDKQTLRFHQEVSGSIRKFYAKQMSDGTLRTFAILLAMLQPNKSSLLVIEEPEIAIHLGALRTMVEILRANSDKTQILITTHSADIVDNLPVDSIRVVWSEGGASHIAPVAEHSKRPVIDGLITPGELLRSDALDPALA